MKKQHLYIIILSALTIALSVTAFFISFNGSARFISRSAMREEISALQSTVSDMKANKADLSNTINNLTADLGTKETINQYYIDYKKTNDALKSDIDALQKQGNSLDEQIKEKQSAISAASMSDEKKGKSYTLKANEIYTCPDKLPAGRYIVSGGGSLIIYAANGNPRVNENLDVAYNNSYTLDLKKDEQIRITDSAVITELK